MIYIGDGATDVPSMKMLKRQGGKSIALYERGNKEKEEKCEELLLQNRINYHCEADYRENTSLDITIKKILKFIARNFD
jgi:hypothetical protein